MANITKFNSDMLGTRYDSLKEAEEFRKSNEIIITDNHDTYYCVTSEVYQNGPYQLGYVVEGA